MKESLEYAISPIYHNLRYINSINNAGLREKEIQLFFLKYSSPDTDIFKVSSLFLINSFYDAEGSFKVFQGCRNEREWEIFCKEFKKFYCCIDNEYFEACSILSTQYRWAKELNNSNIWIRLCKELIKFLYELTKVLIIIIFLFFYFVFTMSLSKAYDLSFLERYKDIIAAIITATITLFGFLMMLNGSYLSIYSMQKREGIIKKIIKKNLKKKLPKLYNWYENRLKNFLKKDDNYPEMYVKKDIDVEN